MAADKETVLKTLQKMVGELSAADSFTLIVSNHGGNVGRVCIYLWGNEYVKLEILFRF